VIAALWKVPDEATKELMLDFYRRIWVERNPRGRPCGKRRSGCVKPRTRVTGEGSRDEFSFCSSSDQEDSHDEHYAKTT
jgi:hypothetical protein